MKINFKERTISLKDEHKRVLNNFVSLSILKAFNYVLPLLTLPYLIKIIGIDYIGLLAFVTSVISYMEIFTDYGFNLTATKEISINRNLPKKVNEIFSTVLSIKIILTVLCLLALTVLVFIFNLDPLIYYFTFGNVIGQALFPIWFFQGIEKMKYVTFLNVLAKLLFTVAIFIFVKTQEDFYLVPLLNAVGFIVTGTLALVIVTLKFGVIFYIPSLCVIKKQLEEGWYIFSSNFFGTLYRNTNVIILGLLTNNLAVGYYSIAEKIIKSLQSLQNVIGTTLFPYLSKKINEEKSFFVTFSQRFSKFIIGGYFFYSLIIFCSSNIIISILANETTTNVLINFKILCLAVFFGGLNYFYGILGLVVLGYNKHFSKYVVITGIFNLFLCSVLSVLLKDIGGALSLVCSELLLLVLIMKKTNQIKNSL